MRITEAVPTATGEILVRELTVGEIRAWLAALSSKTQGDVVDVAGELLCADMSVSDLGLFVDGDWNADGLFQSELRAVIDAAKRVNPDFFGLRERLLMAGTMAAYVAPAAPSMPLSTSPSP